MTNAIEIKNLTKTFSDTVAVNNLTLNIEKGKITGLIGADGSGKTTLLRLIIGLLGTDSGEIYTLGLDPTVQKNMLNEQIGYMPQKFGLYEDLTVIENLKLYADLKKVPYQFSKLLEFTDLTKFQTRLAGKLSGGMKQKLGLACTLLGKPRLLVLDEPSVGVDPISRQELMRLIKESIDNDTTVIWSTAYLDEAQNFDISIIMDKGKLIFNGKPSELGVEPEIFEDNVINLMGGYEKKESLVAKNYTNKVSDIEFPVQALDLCKKYGDFYAVKNNTFHIKKGEIFGLLGPNGAGKSTSFKMMCGLTKPTCGTATIDGVDILKDPSKARSKLGYVAQKFSLYGDLTVRENLLFFAGIYGINILKRNEKVNKMLEVFELQDMQHQPSKSLPLGFKQRLSIACALIHEPPILFLDEPTSGIDVIARREFWNHINSLSDKGVTILVTTHFMDEAEYCHRLSLFYNGETIAIGTPNELKEKANANNMQEAFITLIKENEK